MVAALTCSGSSRALASTANKRRLQFSGVAEFGVVVISNTVTNVRIDPDRE